MKMTSISLEQLMAYCVTDDHKRQEQVFEGTQDPLEQRPRLNPPPADRENPSPSDDKRALLPRRRRL